VVELLLVLISFCTYTGLLCCCHPVAGRVRLTSPPRAYFKRLPRSASTGGSGMGRWVSITGGCGFGNVAPVE
jgi:hypothetical protein